MKDASMEKKRIVVTGANGRLGSTIVDVFQRHGASVIRLVRDLDESDLPTYECDVTDEKSVEECFSAIASEQGKIDGLVHTVGMWKMGPFVETSLADWNLISNVNLTSSFLCFREAVRHGTDKVRIIGFASQQGADGGVAKQAPYSASKAGVMRLVESIAAEYSGSGRTINAIAPRVIKNADSKEGVAPEDIARMCLFLCSDDAAAVSGTVIRMYGDSSD